MVARNSDDKLIRRPLSPHLQVYRWPISMALSIVASRHRRRAGRRHAAADLVAGRGGDLGSRRSPAVQWFLATPIGLLLLFGWSAGAVLPFLRRHPPSGVGRRLRLRATLVRPIRLGGGDRNGGGDAAALDRRPRGVVRRRHGKSSTHRHHALAARPRARPGLGQGGRDALVGAAADLARAGAADAVVPLRHDPHARRDARRRRFLDGWSASDRVDDRAGDRHLPPPAGRAPGGDRGLCAQRRGCVSARSCW